MIAYVTPGCCPAVFLTLPRPAQYAIRCLGKPSFLHRDSVNSQANRDETACKSPNRCASNSANT